MESQFKWIKSSASFSCLSLYVSSLSFSQFHALWVNYWAEKDFTIIKIYTRFSPAVLHHISHTVIGACSSEYRRWTKLYFNTVHIFCLKYPYCIYQDVRTANQTKMVRRAKHNTKEKKTKCCLQNVVLCFQDWKKLTFFSWVRLLKILKSLSFPPPLEDVFWQTNCTQLP